ncbi:hypothetical protein V3391_06520 [Luteimonas sp. SMYT11W]|uniref:Uncharacterized protein n=1 Tax=Luteimonas flava TaxID=3115822 RepID=A0ABU7WD14_9GAMM
MSNPALAAMDAAIHGALRGAGIADEVQYLAPSSEPGAVQRPVRAYVDRDIETIGDMRQVVAGRTEVAFILEPGFDPKQRGTVRLADGLYDLAKPISNDGSISRWMVTRART